MGAQLSSDTAVDVDQDSDTSNSFECFPDSIKTFKFDDECSNLKSTNLSVGESAKLTINGKQYNIPSEVPADCSLNWFIREYAHLKGTKFMCLEGGCGACIVMLQRIDPWSKQKLSYAVNSCLVPVYSCHGWSVTTIEGIGNQYKGYHKVQSRLAAANGTQCGYCSPGMVMNMYSLLQQNPKITMREVENSFGGNICRCTGYRPILEAFKSLARDAPKEMIEKYTDVEDTMCAAGGFTCNNSCNNACFQNQQNEGLFEEGLQLSLTENASWYRASSVKEVFEIIDMIGERTYSLIAGNTGTGVYRVSGHYPPQVYIDVNLIPETHGHTMTMRQDQLTLGANMSLSQTMDVFYSTAKRSSKNFGYLKAVADHMDLIANVPVRNHGTLAGNIMLKHYHNEFPSDLFLLLETTGSKVYIEEISGLKRTLSMTEFLKYNMIKKIITKIILPSIDSARYVFRTFKIMPRAQNAHAMVNAGFLFQVDKSNQYRVLSRPTIVYGGIRPNFIHAEKTEGYLAGKQLLSQGTLNEALKILENELKPDNEPTDTSPEYRRGLAVSLFYKFILSLAPEKINKVYRSGGSLLTREISTAVQDYETDPKMWPLNKPISKLEAIIQCAGETEYSNDLPQFPNQLWAQLVLTDRAQAAISKIDPSEALKMAGVVVFYSAKDIPGVNNFIPLSIKPDGRDPLFADGKSSHAGQVVGMIVAETHLLAITAAKKVKITYKNSSKLVLSHREVIQHNMTGRIREKMRKEATAKKSNVAYTIQGSWDTPGQYHFPMETISCVAVPVEDAIEVYPTTQWPSSLQEAVCQVLAIPESKVIVKVRRLGGGYGSKIVRPNQLGAATALAAKLLHRPVRCVMQLENTMQFIGKRFRYCIDYDGGIDEEGVIQFMDVKIYEDNGYIENDSSLYLPMVDFMNCYDASTWTFTGYGVNTDHVPYTWCRAPGSVDAITAIEIIMEQIASIVKKDPIEIRLLNMNPDHEAMPELFETIKKTSDFQRRKTLVEQFNKENRWKKRGISLMPMDFSHHLFGNFHAMVSIFNQDGSVAVSHGGVEIGQGMNTKVVQIASKLLGVDMKLVTVRQLDTVISPNNFATGANLGSECIAYAVKACCDELNERLGPIRRKLGTRATWHEVVKAAVLDNINLNCSHMWTNKDDIKPYQIYGAAVSEVEVDILTGQFQLVRVDLIEDVGTSMSPEIDVGQVEGGFIMGLGYFTSEHLIYSPQTGKLLTDRTWNYKPPGAKDIPADFRVALRKKAPNPVGVLRSKAVGEPSVCLSASVMIALRNAILSSRRDAGDDSAWVDIELPYSPERIWTACLNNKNLYKL